MQPIKLVMCFGLALSAGCLSVTVVPQSDDEDADVAMSSSDATVETPDAGDGGRARSDAGRDANVEPIVDARVVPDASMMPDARMMEDGRVAPVEAGTDASADTGVGCGPCNGVCRQGECQPDELPECTPGARKNCLIKPPLSDWWASAFQLHGEFLYWVERGTTDAFNNPKNDGALARMRIGEWKREVLVDSLDFFDEGLRAFVGINLWVDGNTAVWWVTPSVRFFLSGIDDGPRVRGELLPGVPWCLSAEGAYHVAESEFGRAINPIFVDRYDGKGRQLIATVPRSATSCAVVGGYLYAGDSSSITSGWRVSLAELGTPEQPRSVDGWPAPFFDFFTSSDWPNGGEGGPNLWSNGTSLFKRLADGRIGMAPNVADFDVSSFRAITEPGVFVHADEKHIYWSSYFAPLNRAALHRLRLDGSDPQHVAAHDWRYRGPRVNEHAVAWWREDIATFEIAYFPASAGAQ